MAKSARSCVFEGMELLPEALAPFVERRLENSLKGHWQVQVFEAIGGLRPDSEGAVNWDQQALFNVMNRFWREAFADVLGREERAWVNELSVVRNKLSHNESFTYDDAERALDTMRRLVEAVNEGEIARQLGGMRQTVLRTKWREEQRGEERRKSQQLDISVETMAGLQPWREVIVPHDDVARGEFLQSEFAADLATVTLETTAPEYRDPREFFSRTYLTAGLSRLLLGAARRLSGTGGDPVVELQTNFGGGKTHSMLALYHMTGSMEPRDLPGVDQLLGEGARNFPRAINRAILVGTAHSPGSSIVVGQGGDGQKQEVRTLWGYMAWQLGGAEGYAMLAENDANGISPGSRQLGELFHRYAPCLILIDEWVAYLRQIYNVPGLPSGSFDANLSFAQALTEAVKASPQALLVASLPASQIEVGGAGGQEALERLKQTFSRVQSSWQPANQEESYEIVRRRLFRAVEADNQRHLDNTVKQFGRLYREHPEDFPAGCDGEAYRRKLASAYPVHPRLFDQLYESWGSLEKFQRTRGVLRLMAQVVHELWMGADKSVMIMPGSVAVSSERVEPELLHYLDQSWQSIIAGDVDGQHAIPYQIDQSAPNLGRYSAAIRVARSIFMETAPLSKSQNRGVEARAINLGVTQPGEKVAIFGDALRRLASRARFLHHEGGRYWYSMSASLNREAADRAAQFEEALIIRSINEAVTAQLRKLGRGVFAGVHATPCSSGEIPDECDGVRLVLIGADYPSSGRWNERGEAEREARDILAQKGSAPRVYRNTLVFLAPEKRALAILSDTMREHMAWQEIYAQRGANGFNLPDSEVRHVEDKLKQSEKSLKNRLRETWCCLLYAGQETPTDEPEWNCKKFSVSDDLLEQLRKHLVGEEGLFTDIGPERLNRVLKACIWHDKPHLHLRDIWEYLNRYLYLPRMKDQSVLVHAVQKAIGGLTVGPFAYASYHDAAAGHYDGLLIQGHGDADVKIDSESVIVRTDIAIEQQAMEGSPVPGSMESGGGLPLAVSGNGEEHSVASPSHAAGSVGQKTALPTHFMGAVSLSADRPSREFSRIVEGIIEELANLPGSSVELELEIRANVPQGLDRAKVRTLLENATTLNFTTKDIE